MDPILWQRVTEVCASAFARPPAERAAFIAAACAGDPGMLREVEAQVAAYEADPDFLERPVARVSELGRGPDSVRENQSVGPYRFTRLLARGGMGEVYLATYETEDFSRTVAVKLIREGFDTDEVVRRFRLERRILASLNHPNIAQLLGGGATEEGRPYFVMEYVEGTPIDEYCERHRLAPRERLRLFLEICAAVQHAHQNLVIHRDLKPSNILVTTEGAPKLLDFGIGKLLAADQDAVATHVHAFTPEFASPEQIRGDPVSTASDVYSLGVLLHLLLTGRRPFTSEPPDTLSRAMARDARPGGTATTSRPADISGDLQHIVNKALRREPEWRYPLVTTLADDIQRYMDGLPVKARADTLAYRTGKFLRRHRWPVAAAAALFVSLVATTFVTLRQSRLVAQERDRALEVRTFLLETFGARSPDAAVGNTITARQLLDVQAARLDSVYGDRPLLHAEMLEVVADGYDRLGILTDAERLARAALSVRRASLGERHADVATSLNLLGWVLHERGASDEAEQLLR